MNNRTDRSAAAVNVATRRSRPPETTRELQYKVIKRILNEAASHRIAGPENLMGTEMQKIDSKKVLDKMLEGKNGKESVKILTDILTDNDSSMPLRQAARDRICSINRENDPAREALW